MNSTVRQYLDQYVKTAGRGNVEVEWAVLTQRVHFICKKCKEELTSWAPIDLYTIDYDIQDWVRFHSHRLSFCEPSQQMPTPMSNGRPFTRVPPPPPEPSPTTSKALKTRQGRKFR